MGRDICKTRFIALGVFFSLILVRTGYGASYYVAVDGNDSSPGTEPEPFRTIRRAADIVQPGDTVNVGPGIYRETVIVKNSGTEAEPIVFRTDPNHRAVITGAEVVTAWKVFDGNENIYYADVPNVPDLPDWTRRRFFKEDGKILTPARIPEEGWWVTEEADSNTLIDTLNLARFAEPNDLIGAQVFYKSVSGNDGSVRIVIDYNFVTKQLTFDNVANNPTPGKDHYYIRNKLNLLTRPGEWVLDTRGEVPRFYVRPSDDGDIHSHVYEYARRVPVVNVHGKSHISIEGFEIRDGLLYGVYGSVEGFKLLNCRLTGHAYMAVSIGGRDIVIRDNVTEENSYGVYIRSAENVLVGHNHIFNGYNDGLILCWDVNNATIIDNFVHDHLLWGHPDNLQFYEDVNNVVMTRNVFLNGGQSMMLGKTLGGQITNNLIVGSVAYSITLGYAAYPYKITGNTIALSGYGLIRASEPNGLNGPWPDGFSFDYELKNNIICPGHKGIYSFPWAEPNVYANYNLVYQADTGGAFGQYEDTWAGDLQQWQSISGLDSNSKEANPLFVSAPGYFLTSAYAYLCTRSKVYLSRAYAAYVDIGDHIETNFDGVNRTVISKGSQPYTDNEGNAITISYVEIEPELEKHIETDIVIANWKAAGVGELDFRLQRQAAGYPQDSPALGMGEHGSDVGYEVNLPGLRRSDFDGDGVIDDPRYRTLTGDLNNDRRVDLADFAILAGYWREPGCNEPDWCLGCDFDHSGTVEYADLSVLAGRWLDGPW
ncbi:MAG: right-handed parallel beta-helix repeat-containing protein [Planctomycetota bacterium]|jgi:hypothetical protein